MKPPLRNSRPPSSSPVGVDAGSHAGSLPVWKTASIVDRSCLVDVVANHLPM
jgi:hypothetical protein